MRMSLPLLLLAGSAAASEQHRLVAYLENWKPCPSDATVAKYTHIMVGFATTYQGVGFNSASCTLATEVQTCADSNWKERHAAYRALGIKMIISVGGGAMNGHWAACVGKEAQLAEATKALVTKADALYDGADIDYEDSAFAGNHGNFLSTLTNEMRARLPAPQYLLTWAPIDKDIYNMALYNIATGNGANWAPNPTDAQGVMAKDQLAMVADKVDFVMVQYYNGVSRPNQNGFTGSGWGPSWPFAMHLSAQQVYDFVLNDCLGGDQNKMVFGFCTGDCNGDGGYNVDGASAVATMEGVQAQYPDNGGAMFWAVGTGGSWDDVGGRVSGPLDAHLAPLRGPTAPPSPTSPPTTPPPTTSAPTLPPGSFGQVCKANPVPVGNCGPNHGNAICDDAAHSCCSPFGWCGVSADHCTNQQLAFSCTTESVTPPPTTAAPVQPTAQPTSAQPTSAQPTVAGATMSCDMCTTMVHNVATKCGAKCAGTYCHGSAALSCSTGLVFAASVGTCDWPANHDCVAAPPTPPPTVAEGSELACAACFTSFYAVPTKCGSTCAATYCHGSAGLACASGLVFDAALGVCNWPASAGCASVVGRRAAGLALRGARK